MKFHLSIKDKIQKKKYITIKLRKKHKIKSNYYYIILLCFTLRDFSSNSSIIESTSIESAIFL